MVRPEGQRTERHVPLEGRWQNCRIVTSYYRCVEAAANARQAMLSGRSTAATGIADPVAADTMRDTTQHVPKQT